MAFGDETRLCVNTASFRYVDPPSLATIEEQRESFWAKLPCGHALEYLIGHARCYYAMYNHKRLNMGPCPYILCGVTALCAMELLMNQGLKFEAGAETRVLHAWTSVIKTEVAGSWVVTASELAAAMAIFLPLEFRAAAILDGLVQRVFAEVRSFLDREGACVAMALNWAMLPSPQPVSRSAVRCAVAARPPCRPTLTLCLAAEYGVLPPHVPPRLCQSDFP